MSAPRFVLILSENWTMTPGRDLPTLVRWAREAEDAGFDAVMISEHIVLGRSAGANGVMVNPREYALPGNQDPSTPWPSSLVLLSAIAAVTTQLRLVAGAIIAPLRHPLILARELGTLDRAVCRKARRAANCQLAPRRVRRAWRRLHQARPTTR